MVVSDLRGVHGKFVGITEKWFVPSGERASPEVGAAAGLYDWLIGSWNIRVVDCEDNGSSRNSIGECHFGWVPKVRAIQDVFIVPSRDKRSGSLPAEGNRYGTSVRVFDPRMDAGHITWINPVHQVHNHLTDHKVGNEIIQEGTDEDGSLMRWSFVDITSSSFRWTGE